VKSEKLKKQQKTLSIFFNLLLVIFLLLFILCPLLSAEIRDRVVASVDNTAITLSELEEIDTKTQKVTPGVIKDEVLNTMINRVLLLREAKKLKLDAHSEDEMLRDYLDLKIRPFIRIKEEELTDFYEKHIRDFYGQDFEQVREKIETYLTEKEMNEHVKMHINELRGKTYIKLQLK